MRYAYICECGGQPINEYSVFAAIKNGKPAADTSKRRFIPANVGNSRFYHFANDRS